MAKTYKVAVHGLMKKNGQMAKFGDELGEQHLDNIDHKLQEGLIQPTDVFDAARKKDEDEVAASKAAEAEKNAPKKEK